MPAPRKQTFVSKNLVTLVMIPSLIGIHIGWRMLQDNRKLVTADEQIDLPPITVSLLLIFGLKCNYKHVTFSPVR